MLIFTCHLFSFVEKHTVCEAVFMIVINCQSERRFRFHMHDSFLGSNDLCHYNHRFHLYRQEEVSYYTGCEVA